MNLTGYSPDFNADEAVWGWVREEATGNLCLGTKTLVHEKMSGFFACRRKEVIQRCRTVLQSSAEGSLRNSQPDSQRPASSPNPPPNGGEGFGDACRGLDGESVGGQCLDLMVKEA